MVKKYFFFFRRHSKGKTLRVHYKKYCVSNILKSFIIKSSMSCVTLTFETAAR